MQQSGTSVRNSGGVSVLMDDTFIAVFAQHSRPDVEPIARQLAPRAVIELD